MSSVINDNIGKVLPQPMEVLISGWTGISPMD